MNLRTFCNTALSVAAAAALAVPTCAQSSYPNYPSNSQQSSPSQQQNYPNQGYPSQHQNYPTPQQTNPDGMANHPENSPSYSGRDRDRDQNRAGDMAEGQHNWSTDQILTATVHQAWILSGKNEQNFFDIVRQLAEISASNRNLTLPNDPASGRKAGEYIKEQARADHDQLLYDIVDKAVRMTAQPAPQSASANQ